MFISCSLAVPHHVGAIPDTDPVPACHFDSDPDQDPTFHFDADPDGTGS
jgi:hypothetical protein